MKRLELGIVIVGASLMVLSLAAFDWRLGLFLAGIILVVSVIDLPRARA